jgi:diguanylate cyclase (GGDEF)-like protein
MNVPFIEEDAIVPPPAVAADVLVVEDDSRSRGPLTMLLEEEGLRVREAAGVTEAVAAMQERVPQILITDINLPDGSGYDVVRALRRLPGGTETAALVVSGRRAFLDKVEAVRSGADGYFEKPLDWAALWRRLQQLRERRTQEPATVLCVEDDPAQARYLRAILESAGYGVAVCREPGEFESVLGASSPSLVIMDVRLPGLSGFDLVRYLRQDERYAMLPVLFLTVAPVTARVDAEHAGGDEVLQKPVSPDLLLAAVRGRIARARTLQTMLEHDGLTHLLTHAAFLERARKVHGRENPGAQRPPAWVMIDLDRFKSINDAYGHPVGDKVLVALASLLKKRLRQVDAVGRYGGEEFAVVLENVGEAHATRLVARLLEEFAGLEHTGPDASAFHATFSAGVAVLREGMSLEAWRQAADQALYEAKRSGRNRVIAAGV